MDDDDYHDISNAMQNDITHTSKERNTLTRKRDYRRQDVVFTNDSTDEPIVEIDDNEESLFMESLLNPNFDELSRQFPYFKKAYDVVTKLMYQSKRSFATCITPEFSIAISRALLHVHFGISLQLQDEDNDTLDCSTITSHEGNSTTAHSDNDNIHSSSYDQVIPYRFLCPPIPNRFYYVQWIVRTLLPLLSNSTYYEQQISLQRSSIETTSTTPVSNVYGLDIGTGATCIYPLLFSHFNNITNNNIFRNQQSPTIIMHATDIDPNAVVLAKTNAYRNHLQSYVHVHLVPKSFHQQQDSNSNDHMEVESKRVDDNKIYDRALLANLNPPYQQLAGPLIQSLNCVHKTQQVLSSTTSVDVPTLDTPTQQFDFVMTNPPFYDTVYNTKEIKDHIKADNGNTSKNDIVNKLKGYENKRMKQRRQNLKRRTTCMTVNEGYYPNGEIGFGLDMIVDSWNLYAESKLVKNQQLSTNSNAHTDNIFDEHNVLKLPHWISMMCGKKTTFEYIHHILMQLLGPAHICTTEFGPGEHTRWFVAYTYHRPMIRSPFVKFNTKWNFNVTLDIPTITDDLSSVHLSLCREVASRFNEYCRTFPITSNIGFPIVCEEILVPNTYDKIQGRCIKNHTKSIMKLEIYEKQITENISCSSSGQHPNNSWVGDESLPDCIQYALRRIDNHLAIRNDLLPTKYGHFVLDVILSVVPAKHRICTTVTTHKEYMVHVQIDAYRHSTYGQNIINKMKSQIESEICRTNRRWRRLIVQQQHQNEKVMPPTNDNLTPMDESN
jgi:23S rRNA A1618 N6-methylase RlmF